MGLRVSNPFGAISPNKVVKNKKVKSEKKNYKPRKTGKHDGKRGRRT